MPKIDLAAVPERKGVGYPSPFQEPCADRIRQRLGDAGGRFTHKDGSPYPDG